MSDVTSIRIRYWYMGNPYRPSGPNVASADIPTGGPRGYKQWQDTNGDGETRDEYICKVGEKHADEIALATDQTRQASATVGWTFYHGVTDILDPGSTDAKRLRRSWKTTVYADGHCESKRPDEVKWRWGVTAPAAW